MHGVGAYEGMRLPTLGGMGGDHGTFASRAAMGPMKAAPVGAGVAPTGYFPPPGGGLIDGGPPQDQGAPADRAPIEPGPASESMPSASGAPPWLMPLFVGVGGLALVGGVLVILKKKGKI